ncbi:MAG: dihydrofolate reductase [Methylobacillus sp.]|jgi:dihydrofolate reductase|nr:dihydrofolate reductase [Methylobacillus sp.]
MSNTPRLSIISAVADNRAIGLDNNLPWHLPEDLKHFRRLTMGHHIIMGRKTYESLARLLPGRTTVIVTRQPDYRVEGAIIVRSLQEALASCGDDKEVFVIGGAEIYQAALPLAGRLYLTEVRGEFPADAFFPEYDKTAWRETSREQHVSENGLAYSFVVYERRV